VDDERGAPRNKKADERSDKEVKRTKERARESVNGQIGGAEPHGALGRALSLLRGEWGGELNLERETKPGAYRCAG
jgi:hypothetical protein